MTLNKTLAVVAALLCSISISAQTLPYQNSNLSAHERAVDLCSRLTLEEKAKLMLDERPAIPRLGIKKCSTLPAPNSVHSTTAACLQEVRTRNSTAFLYGHLT